MKRLRNGAFSEVESERNDANEPQTEARACAVSRKSYARDEHGLCGAERAWSRGRQGGDRESMERSKTPALVTAGDNRKMCATKTPWDQYNVKTWFSLGWPLLGKGERDSYMKINQRVLDSAA